MGRYLRFARMRAEHPGATLVPAADIALLWHTHLGLSGQYGLACRDWFGAGSGAWEPAYLDLERGAMVKAYGDTARLYEQTYDEPYSCPDTAWLPELEPLPLLSPLSPLAFAARAFRDNPAALEEQAGLRAAEMTVALCGGAVSRLLPPPGREPPRPGGHVLYGAWLASTAAARFFDEYTCHRLCFTRSWSIRVATVERMVMTLVAVGHMRYLVDRSDHPFMQAIAPRRGLWRPERPAEGAGASAGASEASPGCTPAGPAPAPAPAPGMFAGAGFSQADPEAFLDDPAMCGLSALLAASHAARTNSFARGGGGSGGGGSGGGGGFCGCWPARARARQPPAVPRGGAPLWAILSAPEYEARPRKLFEHLWAEALDKGVRRVLSYSEAELFYS